MILQSWIFALGAVSCVSLVSLIGAVTLAINIDKLRRVLKYFVCFAVGVLFGDAFIHILPEAFETRPGSLYIPFSVLAGILFFFVLEKVIHWRHCHASGCERHAHPMVVMNLIGDMVHNFIDGILIGASFCVSVAIGITTTLEIICHEIPQEIGDFSVLIYGGFSVRKPRICIRRGE